MAAPMNSSRVRLLQENVAFAATLPHGARVLDAGAGSHPYRDLFAHTQYESADFDPRYSPTHVCDLTQIPVGDDQFDAVVCNQVLEHVRDPVAVLREIRRVLRPSGRLIYSAPLFYEEHQQPYDFYRYTQYGVRHLFAQAALVIDRLDWLEGYFGTVGYQFETMRRELPRHPKHYGGGAISVLGWAAGLGLKATSAVLSWIFHRLELRHKFTSGGYPKNYVVIAHKPPVTL
jgi:SAM-dependent methyltransferase